MGKCSPGEHSAPVSSVCKLVETLGDGLFGVQDQCRSDGEISNGIVVLPREFSPQSQHGFALAGELRSSYEFGSPRRHRKLDAEIGVCQNLRDDLAAVGDLAIGRQSLQVKLLQFGSRFEVSFGRGARHEVRAHPNCRAEPAAATVGRCSHLRVR